MQARSMEKLQDNVLQLEIVKKRKQETYIFRLKPKGEGRANAESQAAERAAYYQTGHICSIFESTIRHRS